MHCFVDDLDTAKQAIDLNFYISFSGIVTFRNAQALQDVAKQVPLDRILVGNRLPLPGAGPLPRQAESPAYVRFVAEKLPNCNR